MTITIYGERYRVKWIDGDPHVLDEAGRDVTEEIDWCHVWELIGNELKQERFYGR